MEESHKARKSRRERENLSIRRYSPFSKNIEHYLLRMALATETGDLDSYNTSKTKLERLYRFIKSDPEWREKYEQRKQHVALIEHELKRLNVTCLRETHFKEN